jgi:hypothetical protein
VRDDRTEGRAPSKGQPTNKLGGKLWVAVGIYPWEIEERGAKAEATVSPSAVPLEVPEQAKAGVKAREHLCGKLCSIHAVLAHVLEIMLQPHFQKPS